MKQLTIFARDEDEGKYVVDKSSPIYSPKNRSPHILELIDNAKTQSLLRDIEKSSVSIEEKNFLASAARRHTSFNYELIADYYAHASPEMQRLMEDSALVIVDIDSAIKNGYVRLCENIRRIHMEELSKNA